MSQVERLKIALPKIDLRRVTPFFYPGPEANALSNALFTPLVNYNQNYELQPGLLSRWTYDQSSSSYHLTLNSNAKFHSGRPVTAADVEFSFQRGLLPTSHSFISNILDLIEGSESITSISDIAPGAVKGLKVLNNQELVVHLKEPYSGFLDRLAIPRASIVHRDALSESLEAWKQLPDGTGPYRVQSSNDETLSLVKVDSHFSVETSLAPKYLDFIASKDLKSTDLYLFELGSEKSDEWEGYATTQLITLSVRLFADQNDTPTARANRQDVVHHLNREDIAKRIQTPGFQLSKSILPSASWMDGSIRLPSKPKSASSKLNYSVRVLMSSFFEKESLFGAVQSALADHVVEIFGKDRVEIETVGNLNDVQLKQNQVTLVAFPFGPPGIDPDSLSTIVNDRIYFYKGATKTIAPITSRLQSARSGSTRESRAKGYKAALELIAEEALIYPIGEIATSVYLKKNYAYPKDLPLGQYADYWKIREVR